MAADDQSSIPSVVDGMTPAQRTSVLSALMDRFAKDFNHYESAYGRLWKLINLVPTRTGIGYGMAQNITLNVNPIYLFRLSDKPLRKYLTTWEHLSEENIASEPTWLIPIIPMVLVNGGIDTKYNPRDVIANIRRLLNGEEFVPMDGKKAQDTLLINEEEILKVSRKGKGKKTRKKGLFESTTDLDTSNMLLFDTKGRKKKYGSPEEILKDFFALRLESYEERKLAMLKVIESAVSQLEDISMYYGKSPSDTIILDYRKEDEVLYAEAKNHLLRCAHYPMGGIELEYDRYTEWKKLTKAFDILKDNISVKELWLNDLDALEKQLNEQYEKEAKGRKKRIRPVSDSESQQEPSEVTSSSLEEDVSLEQDEDDDDDDDE